MSLIEADRPAAKPATSADLQAGHKVRNFLINLACFGIQVGSPFVGLWAGNFAQGSYAAQKIGPTIFKILTIAGSTMVGAMIVSQLQKFVVRPGQAFVYLVKNQEGEYEPKKISPEDLISKLNNVDALTIQARNAESAYGDKDSELKEVRERMTVLATEKGALHGFAVSLGLEDGDSESLQAALTHLSTKIEGQKSPNLPAGVSLIEVGGQTLIHTTVNGKPMSRPIDDVVRDMVIVDQIAGPALDKIMSDVEAVMAENGDFRAVAVHAIGAHWDVQVGSSKVLSKKAPEQVAKTVADRLNLAFKGGQADPTDLSLVRAMADEFVEEVKIAMAPSEA